MSIQVGPGQFRPTVGALTNGPELPVAYRPHQAFPSGEDHGLPGRCLADDLGPGPQLAQRRPLQQQSVRFHGR
jgi:hypothetical protein